VTLRGLTRHIVGFIFSSTFVAALRAPLELWMGGLLYVLGGCEAAPGWLRFSRAASSCLNAVLHGVSLVFATTLLGVLEVLCSRTGIGMG
jgi:hypothetical protein